MNWFTTWHAERTFTLRTTPDGSSTVVVSHETQVGPLPWLGRVFLAPRLHAVNQAMFDDLNRPSSTSDYQKEMIMNPTTEQSLRRTVPARPMSRETSRRSGARSPPSTWR